MADTLADLLDGLDESLRRNIFTHSSWADDPTDSYERLAFLGDSVLGLSLSAFLMPRFADATAGRLTKIRAQAVSGRACARVAERLEVPRRLAEAAPAGAKASAEDLSRTERAMASICEAIIGACYLRYGFDPTARAVADAFAGEIDEALDRPLDFKSELQERLARRGDRPVYVPLNESGPAHDRTFECAVEIRRERYGTGAGRSKKEAEQTAAAAALARLEAEALAEET